MDWLFREDSVQFFSIGRIVQATDHLSAYRSDWTLIPLVFAVNGVDDKSLTDVQSKDNVGTSTFLDKYFSGGLIGLPPLARGNTLRPAFSDVVLKKGDKISHQSVNLWGSGFSSRGYREWAKSGLIEMPEASVFRLRPQFLTEFKARLKGFHFEELLVWLYGFSGFPDGVDNWDKLFRHFQESEMGPGKQFPAAYKDRFNVKNGVAWPKKEITGKKPLNEAFQQALIPSAYLPPNSSAETFSKNTHLSIETLATLTRLIRDKGQLVLYGPPGTGKTFIARELALNLVDGDEGRVEVVQFHPSYGYEDFVIGLRPEINEESGEITYEAVPGAFLRVCENAQGSDKVFVVIIDEINRGNLPRIFGELLYLLEYRRDSRTGGDPATLLSEATIPHREEPFSVPPNVYVIGTMNSSDRSIGHIDLALRRRFFFFPIDPSEEVLKSVLASSSAPAAATALTLFRNVNRRVREEAQFEYDAIGHSFFLAKGLDEELLRLRYEYSVVPLLKELFYTRPEVVSSRFTYAQLIAPAVEPVSATPVVSENPNTKKS